MFSNIKENPVLFNDKYSALGKKSAYSSNIIFHSSPPHLTFMENIFLETQNSSIKWPSIYTAEINISKY